MKKSPSKKAPHKIKKLSLKDLKRVSGAGAHGLCAVHEEQTKKIAAK